MVAIALAFAHSEPPRPAGISRVARQFNKWVEIPAIPRQSSTTLGVLEAGCRGPFPAFATIIRPVSVDTDALSARLRKQRGAECRFRHTETG